MLSEPARKTPDPTVGARFARAPRSGTAPELRLRKLLHAQGLRYRVNAPVVGLPRRRIDILFTRARLAVSVDGCFWHGCPDHWVEPKTNRDWWAWKIATNRARDADTDRLLAQLGYVSLRIWEHTPPELAAHVVMSSLEEARRLVKKR